MKWDPERRIYLTNSGRPIPVAKVREWVDGYIQNEQSEVDAKTAELLAGAITVAAFFDFLHDKITAAHTASAEIAYGGADQMGPEQWARVAEKINSEIAYLENFEQETEKAYAAAESIAADVAASVEKEIPAGLSDVVQERVLAAITANSVSDVPVAVKEAVTQALGDSVGTDKAREIATGAVETLTPEAAPFDELIWGQVGSRSRMYLESVYGTYENSVKAREGDAGAVGVRRICEDDSHSCTDCPILATDEYVPMDEVTDIGDSECGGNCRCHFEFDYAGIEPLTIDRSVYA